MLQNLFQNIVRVSLSISVLLAVLLLFLPLLRKRYTAKWRCLVWLILAVRLLIPFSPSLPQSAAAAVPISPSTTAAVPAQRQTDSSRYTGWVSEQQTELSDTAASAAADSPSKLRAVTLRELLPEVWSAGMLLILLYHGIGYWFFKKSALRFSVPAGHTHAAELLNEAKEELGISRGVRLLICKKSKSPMITGFFIPLLLLPDLDYSDSDLNLILKHELIHLRRRDIWYKLLMACAVAVHWFNPLIYLMAAISNRDIEMACDSELVGDSDSAFRKQYSEMILSAIDKGNQRRATFSTYFYGGEKTMKKRFINIFDAGKKRKGIAALCTVVVIACIAGTSMAYSAGGHTAGAEIDNLTNLSAGNSYSLTNGKFVISYGTENSSVVPLAVDTDDETTYFEDKAVYISDEVTAVAYGGQYNAETGDVTPVHVLISSNQGQTWSTYPVMEPKTASYEAKFIGFTSGDDGWLLLAGDAAMGRQDNRIFQTADGGKTWSEIGNTDDVSAHVVTGAGFADENIGFVSFRYDAENHPMVYRTEDKGKTWTKCALKIPDSFQSITACATALSPVFHGAKGILPVIFRNSSFDSSGDPVDVTVWYETDDYGKTWTFNEKYNLALIWADAWKTRDGKARYEIMSSKLQKDFRAQQSSPDDPDTIHYSIRWSSPWVTSYHVALDGDQAVITYLYTDSTTSTYRSVERLSFDEESGRAVVTASKTEVEMQEYVDTSDWKAVHTDLFTCSIPRTWDAQTTTDEAVGFTLAANGEQLGTLSMLDYDSSEALTQFVGNHAEIRGTETLAGCNYSAEKVMIRRTQPAAAQDDSYVDETHIYLIPKNSPYAYDLCFTSNLAGPKADGIARSLVIDTDRAVLYGQIRSVGNQWAAAVQKREGKMQYNLMSTALRKQVYETYRENHWVTGVSSPWVDSYSIKPGDYTAVVTYTYMTSDGFAGYYEQTLSLVKENGRLVISAVTEPEPPGGQDNGVVISYLEDRKTYLSARKLANGMFSDMTLSINGRTKSFSWETCGETAFLPELDYADVDGDGQDELIIILCKGEGTGVLKEEIHVLNPEDFSEIKVQDPLSALEDRVISIIDESGVKITVDGKRVLTLLQKDAVALAGKSVNWFQTLETGSIVDYSMEGSQITVEIGAQISPASFLGTYHLTYQYKGNQLIVNSIGFSKGS